MTIRVTKTFVECDIVINQTKGSTTIYVEDFSFETIDQSKLPYWTRITLDPNHVRVFNSMKDFTMFLLERDCIVNKCLITIKDEV